VHVTAIRCVREHSVRSEQAQHAIERIGIEPDPGCGLRGRSAGVANCIGDSGARDDVQTPRGDVCFCEVGYQLGGVHRLYWTILRFRISHSPFTLTIVSSYTPAPPTVNGPLDGPLTVCQYER